MQTEFPRLAAVVLSICLGLALAGCAGEPSRKESKTDVASSSAAPSTQAHAAHASAATAASARSAPATAGNLKPYDEVVKGYARIPGYLTVYKKDERYLLELKKQDFEQPFFFTTTRTRGIGERGLWGGNMLESGIGAFVRHTDKVFWIERNTAYVAPHNKPLQFALNAAFSDSLRGVSAIVCQPDPRTGAVLIDLNALLLSDFSATATLLQVIYHQPYQFDRNNTLIQTVHAEHDETSVSILAHYATGALAVPQPNQPVKPLQPATLPDPRSMFFGFLVSFSPLPSPAPTRVADPRVGYFVTEHRNYDNDTTPHNREFLIHRWRLEKQDPEAAISLPRKPITFWLDRNIPERYRNTVRRGILVWNEAFEHAGFRDAIVVKQQPDDAKWDAAERNYATVKWYLGTDNLSAVGPSLVDHRTGEILDADVVITDFWTRNPRTIVANDLPKAGADTDADCNFAAEAFNDMWQTIDLLAARGQLDPNGPQADAFVQDTLYWVVMHEVGHTLGLRHNFRASSAYTLAQLRDPAFVAKNGIMASVMDYPTNNVPPRDQPVTAYTQKVLGPYDLWAIEYGYKPLPATSADKDLREIAARAETDPFLAYATDEDAGGSGRLQAGIDPAVATYDLGNDPVAWFSLRLQLSAELLDRLATRPPTGSPFESADLRASVERSLGLLAHAAVDAARNVGGVSVAQQTTVTRREVFAPVPAATQRKTLAVLSQGLFHPDSLHVDPALLRRIAPSKLETPGLQEPQLALMNVVLQTQSAVLDQLMSDRVTNRLLEGELSTPAGQARFRLSELYATLHQDIWQELGAGGDIPLMRRNLQRAYLTRLCNQILRPDAATPADARALARREATKLLAELRTASHRRRANAETLAHLGESQATLEEALRAPLLRQTP